MLPAGIRERLEGLERRELVGLVAIAVLLVGAAAVWYLRSLPAPVRVEAVSASYGPTGSNAASAGRSAPAGLASSAPPSIVVDVAGLVRRPGVYEFHQGDRVIDAIRRAGGARRRADLNSLNLAALLTDAEQIVVGTNGAGVGGTNSGGGSSTGAGDASTGDKINVNTGTIDQLEGLPGIGPVLAQRIIDYRTKHGPFRSLDDLLNVSGIGPSHLSDLKASATV